MGVPVVHFEIGCPDKETSREFYEGVFGWKSQPYGPMSHQFDTGSQKGINGFTTSLGHEPEQYVLLYMQVDDISLYIEKVQEAGGEVVIPKTDIPGGGSFSWCKDPAGNMFGLYTPAAE